jgi:ribonuclease BN (tRNA processing enzyme)
MRIQVLGSGTLVPDPQRGSAGFWVESQGEALLIDCGAGTLRALGKLAPEWAGVSAILLTHFHTDHVGDLAPLLFALKHGADPARKTPLSLVGPSGLSAHLRGLEAVHGSYVGNPGFPLRVEELMGEGAWTSREGAFRVRHYSTNHTEASLAFRVETELGTVGFTGDTGPDPALGDFMKGVDVLVAECSHLEGEAMRGHLTPSGLVDLAAHADPDLLVNVHAYPPLDPDVVPGFLRAQGYLGRALAGRDGMLIRILRGVVRVEREGD